MMSYHQNIQGCINGATQRKGLATDFMKPLKSALEHSVDHIRKAHKEKTISFLQLPYMRKDVEGLKELVLRLQDDFSDIIVLGTGGSSLGAQTLCVLGNGNGLQIHFLDNIDPYTFSQLSQKVHLQSTAIIVVSKSGNTPETLVQFLSFAKKWIKEIGAHALKNHFVILTENKPSPLKVLADRWEIPFLEHDPNLGGRFSALSIVGILPAMVAGVNVVAIREGAAQVLDNLLYAQDVLSLAPIVGAAVQYTLASKHQVSQSVLMPYIDRLGLFSKWYRQLWAESLGKDGKGTTPVDALGTVDQHSQLQLYLDGPSDKFFTIITLEHEQKGPKILPEMIQGLQMDFLANATMGDLMHAEQQATIDTLISNGCPTRHMHLKTFQEETLGALMMHFMLETIIVADLYKVNAFDQPAVEQGKKLAKSYLEQYIQEQ